MKRALSLVLLISLVCFNCNNEVPNKVDGNTIENWKQEIYDTEIAFSELAGKEGIPKAFLAFAAKDVVVKKGKRVVVGIDSLRAYYANQKPTSETVTLSWKPDFVAVASSGDLGYTYGKYLYTITDSIGNVTENPGIFHTVWKKQTDGTWKFVWD